MTNIILMLDVFLLTFAIILLLINYQQNRHTGQVERELGLRSHKEKNHTPTLGGIAIIISTIIFFSLIYWLDNHDLSLFLLLIVPFLGYGLLGFIDDYLILKRQNNEGISPLIKFLLQLLIAGIYFFIYLKSGYQTTISIGNWIIDFKFLYGIFILLAFSGFSNATNLTDGIDGLLGFSFLGVLVGYFIINQNLIISQFIAILTAAICAFLWFNRPKAKIFMGNTGALALGSVMVSIAIINKIETSIFVFGLLYVIEVISVILQVSYYKLSKGKRIFKMAPIHHHFEIVYGSERKTLWLMLLLQLIFTILGIIIYK